MRITLKHPQNNIEIKEATIDFDSTGRPVAWNEEFFNEPFSLEALACILINPDYGWARDQLSRISNIMCSISADINKMVAI